MDRRDRLRKLALETIDLTKDPYFMRNHLGQYECRLCLTIHTNEGNYLAHTQASHQSASAQHSQQATCFASFAAQPCHGGGGHVACLLRWVCLHVTLLLICCSMQGKRHQQNLAKRAAREAAEKAAAPAPQKRVAIRKTGGAQHCYSALHAVPPMCSASCVKDSCMLLWGRACDAWS